MPSEIKDTLLVRNELIPVVIKNLPLSKLRFFQENPRIYSILRVNGNVPTQQEIYDQLILMEHVRELRKDIKKNGGLIDPLVVRDKTFEVLEGNSRLAAYRALAEGEELIKWSEVKCKILPHDVKDSLVSALLGEYHIKGKTEWQPYEQAGFLCRRHREHGIDEAALASEVALPKGKVCDYIATYEFMVAHNDNDIKHWSHYYEYLKSSKIRKARKQYSQLDDLIVKKIKHGEISQAVLIRAELPLICNAPEKVMEKFLAGELTFSTAVDKAKSFATDHHELERITKFRTWITDDDLPEALEGTSKLVKRKVILELGRVIARCQALRKNLK